MGKGESLIKLVYCLRRLPSLSREEFQAYWFDRHGPLVRSHQQALKIRRYVQTHTVTAPAGEALAETRGKIEPYDGVAELWWDSLSDLEAALGAPEGEAAGAELLEDEKKFIDLANSPLWLAEERPVIEG